MDIKAIFKRAYALMDEPVINGNCGLLCNYHCCREYDEAGEKMGIYLLPLEYEAMIEGQDFEASLRITQHSGKVYDMPAQIKQLHFIYCSDTSACLRNHRPIQCRTYPFEPHYEDGELTLVVEKDQIHQCPLLKQEEAWRGEFIHGVYAGWQLLLTIPLIRCLIAYDSRGRSLDDVMMRFRPDDAVQPAESEL